MIHALVKIFTEESHAENFQKGDLYMNTIRGFKEWRNEAGELRGDPMEGIIAWYQPQKITLEIGGIEIEPEDVTSPIAVHDDSVLNKNAFCMYSLNSRDHGEVSSETLADFKKTLEIHNSNYDLGAYCVAILDVPSFIDRCSKKMKEMNINGSLGLVDYFDENTFHGKLPHEQHGYQKRNLFKPQREYRILIDLERQKPSHFTMNIGDTSDITSEIMTPDEFNRQLEIRLPDGSSA